MTCASCSYCARLLADCLGLVQLGNPDGPLALGRLGPDRLDLLRVGDLDSPLALRLGHTDRAQLLLLGHVDLGLLDGRRGRLATDGLDVARLVGDVGDVDVDQDQADLLELGLERHLDALEELVAVTVDVLDLHRGDDLTELPEDDVLGLLDDVTRF